MGDAASLPRPTQKEIEDHERRGGSLKGLADLAADELDRAYVVDRHIWTDQLLGIFSVIHQKGDSLWWVKSANSSDGMTVEGLILLGGDGTIKFHDPEYIVYCPIVGSNFQSRWQIGSKLSGSNATSWLQHLRLNPQELDLTQSSDSASD